MNKLKALISKIIHSDNKDDNLITTEKLNKEVDEIIAKSEKE